MVANVTLVADSHTIGGEDFGSIAAPYSIRASAVDDVDQLGALYFRSYEAGEACATEVDAIADIKASFAGDYGRYLYSASPVAFMDSEIVAAVMTVERAPWENTPACPFIIEVFTDPGHRRRGLATALLQIAAADASQIAPEIALRVEDQNHAAIALYENLGFWRW